MSGPPGHATMPPALLATIAIESVSQRTYEPPASVTNRSRIASIKRAAAVMLAAMGEKKYSPGVSGATV